MPPKDLAGLLDRAARHDSAAFAEFYDLTIGEAHLLARAATASDGTEVDEVLRAAYVEAWRHSASFRGTGLSPRAWLLSLIQRGA